MRATSLIAAVVVAGVCVTLPAFAQVDWLPPEMEQAAAGGLLVRLAEVGVEVQGTNEERADKTLQLVRDIAARIDSWGIDGVIERAPELAKIERPDLGDPIATIIADYGICALVLHPELVETRDERATVVLGEYFVMLMSVYLRDWFIDTGGTDEDLERLLASPEMDQLSRDIQADEERFEYVMAECWPMFEELFGR